MKKATWQGAMDHCMMHNSTLMKIDHGTDHKALTAYFNGVYKKQNGFELWNRYEGNWYGFHCIT